MLFKIVKLVFNMKFDEEENDCGDLEDMPFQNKSKTDSFEENFEFGKRFEFYRIFNILTLILLISSYSSIWFFFFYKYNIETFFTFFKPKIHHFRLNYIVFYIIWGLILSKIYTKFSKL